MGRESVDIHIGLGEIWRCFQKAFVGKRISRELHAFRGELEGALYQLYTELNNRTYHHSGYRQFVVEDNKRRQISVTSVRDRIVHRLLYDYLVGIYDKRFIYDVWSSRKGKGLVGAIDRSACFLRSHPHSFVWRADILKFFDSVDQDILKALLARTITDETAMWLLHEVIDSFVVPGAYERERERE